MSLLLDIWFQVARVISSLLAAAILNMRGVAGKPGWFWLFLLEGILTFLIGVTVSIQIVPETPHPDVHLRRLLPHRAISTFRTLPPKRMAFSGASRGTPNAKKSS